MNNTEINNEKKFEDELFSSLKFYGYLFPENVPQVEVFEHLDHKITLDPPSIEEILSTDSDASFVNITDLEIGLAAYSNPDDGFLDIPEEDVDDPEQ